MTERLSGVPVQIDCDTGCVEITGIVQVVPEITTDFTRKDREEFEASYAYTLIDNVPPTGTFKVEELEKVAVDVLVEKAEPSCVPAVANPLYE